MRKVWKRSRSIKEAIVKIKPLRDNVLVKQTEAQDKSKGGIFIPDQAKEKPSEGKVVAVGVGLMEDGKIRPMTVKVGDEVIYNEYDGKKVMEDSVEFMLVSERSIIAIRT
jgi:chaperonin GroES